MDALHGELANTLLQQVRKFKDKDEPIPAALLAQCIKFLKDNGIDRPVREGDTEDLLQRELEGFNPDDTQYPMM